jgi:CrcB protein
MSRRPTRVAPGGRRMSRTRWDLLLTVAAGGAVGSLARWAVAVALPHAGRDFPWATAAVNVAGCGLIGALMYAEDELWAPSTYRRPFLRTGVLGGFTTFSAYGLDAHRLLLAGAPVTAAGYALSSVVAGLAAVWLGSTTAAVAAGLVRRSRRHRPDPPPDRRADPSEEP